GLQERRGPALLERGGRVGLVRARLEVERLRVLIVQRDQRLPSTALLGLASVMRVTQEIFHGGHQKASKPATLPHGQRNLSFFQKPSEEFLGQILRLMRTVTALA